jgi:hypothetical protein
MNMTGAPPATESGKPGCPLLDKTSHRQLRHVGNSGSTMPTRKPNQSRFDPRKIFVKS